MSPIDWIATLLIIGGGFFLVVSSLGILRLPDFFSRSHAVGKSETLGSLLLLLGLAVHNGFALESAKLGLIVFFIAVTNPSGIHVLSRAALRKGLEIWVHPSDRAEARERTLTGAGSNRAGDAPEGIDASELPSSSKETGTP
jgi:multicomponent Na+:H+ antiporter subunit G